MAESPREPASGRRRAGPERMCAACGLRAPARDLLRIVRAPDGGIAVDWRRNLGGRGAHVCPRRACIEAAVSRRRLDRPLRASVSYPDVDELLGDARTAVMRQLETLVRAGASARRVSPGADAAREAMGRGRAACVLLAGDFTAREKLLEEAAVRGIPARALLDKGALGEMAGRRETGVLAIDDRDLAAAIVAAVDRLEALH